MSSAIVSRVRLAAHLLRQSGAAGVIAQHAARFCEPWRDVVPAFERAAHFVNQHQRAVAAAAQLAAQAGAVGFNEIHPAPPGFFRLIFLFVTASDRPVGPKSEVHDTGDGMNLKFPRSGGRRPVLVLRLLARRDRAAGCGGPRDAPAEPAARTAECGRV